MNQSILMTLIFIGYQSYWLIIQSNILVINFIDYQHSGTFWCYWSLFELASSNNYVNISCITYVHTLRLGVLLFNLAWQDVCLKKFTRHKNIPTDFCLTVFNLGHVFASILFRRKMKLSWSRTDAKKVTSYISTCTSKAAGNNKSKLKH